MRGRQAFGALGLAAAGGVAWRAAGRLRASRRAGHTSLSEAEHDAASTRVVILGSGFGGLSTALELDRQLDAEASASVLAIDSSGSLLFTPLLWMVADGRVGPTNVVVPVRAFQRGRRFHVLHADVEGIDLERREARSTAGTHRYDVLVIALGSITAVPDLPGLREHARLFRSPADAVELRNHLITAIEAAHQTRDSSERREWLTFVVGGGGDTGIELAATMHDYIHAGLLAEYPWLAEEAVRIVVVGRADRLVPMSDQGTSRAVRRALESSGIEVMTGVSIESVTDRVVQTSAGEIPARTLFWAAGISAPDVVRALPVEHAKNGALVVDDHLRILEYPEIYVIGDAAWAYDAATGQAVPPTAQAAQHQGRYVARSIVGQLAGEDSPPFRFSPRGHLALLGNRSGVARVGPLTIMGIPAWLLWHGYYLYSIPAWANRLHLLTDWFLASLTGRQTVQLQLRPERAQDGE